MRTFAPLRLALVLLLPAAACRRSCPADGALYTPSVPADAYLAHPGDTGNDWCTPRCTETDVSVDPVHVLAWCTASWCDPAYDGLYCVTQAELDAWFDAHPEWGKLVCTEGQRGGKTGNGVDPYIDGCSMIGETFCYPACTLK